MDKKADVPFWLVMTILILASMIVLILIISASGGKMQEFTDWLSNIF